MGNSPTTIREFGICTAGVSYLLRPGGYAVILNAVGQVAIVSTPLGLAFPGGGQNEGEGPEDAAIREVEEECGLRVSLSAYLGTADELVFAADDGKHYRKRCTFFLATIANRTGAGESDHKLLWVSQKDAAAGLLHESQRWAVAEGARQTRRCP